MKTNRWRVWCIAGLLVLGIGLPGVVHGQANSWTNTNFGKWETNSNWSLGVAPTNTQTATFFTNAPSKTVTIDATTGTNFPGTLTISNLTVSAPAGSANQLFLNNAGLGTPLRILNGLTITTGGTLLVYSNSMVQVANVSSFASLTVDGGGFVHLLNGALLIATNQVTALGVTGIGQMAVTDATVRATNLGVAYGTGSQGTLTLEGATVEMRGDWWVGLSTGAKGAVWMSGGQLAASNGFTDIGASGTGQMTVSNGTVLGEAIFVGKNTGGGGTLTMASGTIHSGLGNLIYNALTVGDDLNSTGAVWISGGQLIATNSVPLPGGASVVIGRAGLGRLTVSNGTVNAGTVTVAQNLGSAGTLTVAGGTLIANQLVATNSTATIQFPAGIMTLGGAEVANGQQFQIGGAGQSAVLNLVAGTNRFADGFVPGPVASSTGIVWMTGGLLVVTNGNLTLIGNLGVGAMTVSNGTVLGANGFVAFDPSSRGVLTVSGGTVQFANLTVADDSNATGKVFVTGGQLNVTNSYLTLGDFHPDLGELTLSNGTVRSVAMVLGNVAGAKGVLTIVGGKTLISSNVVVGFVPCTATGIVSIVGGELRVTNSSANAVLEVRSGTLTQSGGILDVDRLVVTNPCARFIHTGGTLITGLITPLPPDLDADGDGMGNQFEQDNGLDPFNPADAALDNDGDGMSNLQEYTMGTDPNDANSAFRITSIVRTNNDIRITWTIAGGGIFRDYYVQYGTNLLTGVTNNLSPIILAPPNPEPTTNYLDVGGATNRPPRFYRVRGFVD